VSLSIAEEILPGLWRVGGGTWNGTVAALSAEDDANTYLLRGPAGIVLIDCAHVAGKRAIEANVRTSSRAETCGSSARRCTGRISRSSRSSSTTRWPTASASSWRDSPSRPAGCRATRPTRRRTCSSTQGSASASPATSRSGGLRALGFLCALWLSNLDDYVASLRRLEELGLDLLVPGHGAPVRGREAVREAARVARAAAEAYAADPSLRDNFGV
jgi:hypothetical protein